MADNWTWHSKTVQEIKPLHHNVSSYVIKKNKCRGKCCGLKNWDLTGANGLKCYSVIYKMIFDHTEICKLITMKCCEMVGY